MDPYERALEILAATPPVLRSLAAAGAPDGLERRPAEGAWSPREHVDHLWRVETFLGSRIRLILEQDVPELATPSYGVAPSNLHTLLHEWQAARSRNLALFRSLTPEQRERAAHHPRHGRITIHTHVVEAAYHDLDHLRQILAAWQLELYPHIASFQSLYSPPSS